MAISPFLICKVVVIFFCVILFCISMGRLGNKFKDRNWVVATKRETKETKMTFPDITICSNMPYLDFGDRYTEVQFENVTNAPTVTTSSTHEANLKVKNGDVRSYNKGQCHVVSLEKQIESRYDTLKLTVSKNSMLDVYIQSAGYNQLLNFDSQGTDKTYTKLTLNTMKSTNYNPMATIKLKKSIVTADPDTESAARPDACDPDAETDAAADFPECIVKQIKAKVKGDSCHNAWMKAAIPEPGTSECSTADTSKTAQTSYETKIMEVLGAPQDAGCKRSCLSEEFEATVHYMSSAVKDDGHFHLDIMFENFIVEEILWQPLYDGVSMFIGVGGVLAFLLGFSLLSALLDCLDISARLAGKEEELKSSFFRRTLRQ